MFSAGFADYAVPCRAIVLLSVVSPFVFVRCPSAEPAADASGTPGKGESSAFYTEAGEAVAVPKTAEGGKTPSAPSAQAAPTIPSGGVSVTAPSVEVSVSDDQAFAATAPAGRQGGGGGGGGDVLTSMLFGSSGEEKAPASGSSGTFNAAAAAGSGGGGDVGAAGGIAEGAEEEKGSGMFDILERVAAAVGLIASDDEGEGAEKK